MEPNGGLRLILFLFIYVASIIGFIVVMTRRYKNKSIKFTWQTGAIKLDLRVLAGGIAVASILIMKMVLLLLDSLV
ncbi:hypothetical protein SAMN05660909_01992 [Chitinophaga terrae (ex Kim and Jung 2007)]|jgi:hypothetical protein|uniref:Uncharacterized protein n=1 Tax=Chitinophaga terrae (ex Kim and Jung 2007) TaxID=408074 RepID=A0A1H4B9X5_9BACT|nr:hypothetical protein [Chitinophaga terrae (ex Kim and Jung 2007)]MDQ0106268.1 hypothetical protein [Chitinophaga terrae (ex Kim and Jung 2007)]SEA44939.1 hypothetical protein SAMN05660909_01992 [Chitinophaga terrae (ex Kim and Jung 2007)]